MDFVERVDRFCNLISKSRGHAISWNWTAKHLLDLARQYPGGLTEAIIECELIKRTEQAPKKQFRTLEALYVKRETPTLFDPFETHCTGYMSATGSHLQGPPSLQLEDVDVQVNMMAHTKFLEYLAWFKDRTMRFTHCQWLPEDPIKTLLPTENLVIVLDPSNEQDQQLLGTHFTSQFEDAVPEQDHNFVARVVKIEQVVRDNGHEYVQVNVVDGMAQSGLIIFWNNHTHITKLFSVGDSLALWHPLIVRTQQQVMMEHTHKTVVFVMPMEQDLAPSQTGLAAQYRAHPTGLYDMAYVTKRLQIKDLVQGALHVSFFGCVVHCERHMNRLGLRLADSTGICDIYFEGDADVDLGHVVFVENLASFGEKWIGHKDLSSSIWNVTMSQGIPHTQCLSHLSFLKEISQGLYYCKAMVVDLDEHPSTTKRFKVDSRCVW
ncbi:hypothetical protein EDD86DRAFT_203702 [Gorgonomyces haynaldii]|nr:hypothetical protein EDD86DRAFT_203702 [Gorgonomyces haynaldii]